ncbi:MAG: DUF3168 domain-containing protein [Pararhizobium sp.]
MSNPEQALQRAIVAALAADAELTVILGTAGIYDRLIDKASLPYLVLADMTTLDWSTATEAGTEHLVTLEAWSNVEGKRELQAIVGRLRAVLHDQPLPLEAGALVNLRLQQARIERVTKLQLHRATIRLRAVIEAS